MTSEMLTRVDAECPGNPDRTHVWGFFGNAVACHNCSAVRSIRWNVDTLVEQHPAEALPVMLTHLLTKPIYLQETAMADEPTDLESEVIAELLVLVLLGESARLADIEEVATRVIAKVRAA